MSAAIFAGFLSGLSLIAAIGAQNAFVLRQGLRRQHVGWVVAICAISDAVLIVLGVVGLSHLTRLAPWAADAMLWGGVAFLTVYGALRFRAALRGGAALMPASGRAEALGPTLVTCLILTWANPHVWLDTVALLGALATQYAPWEGYFGAGAVLASGVFFSALGFGARYLAPLLSRPRAWVVLEIGIGAVMWAIALSLVMRQLG